MARKRNDFSLNVGTSSILFIFIILCLVSFSILSLSSAFSDYKLSQRVVSNTEAYYNACNRAQETIATFDASLKSLYDTGISRTGFFDKVGKKKNFSIPISDIQSLSIEIKILYPKEAGEPFYEISEWFVETTGELEYEDTLPVYK